MKVFVFSLFFIFIVSLPKTHAQVNSIHVERQNTDDDLSGWYKIKFPPKKDIHAIVDEYKAVTGVLDAQPIGIHALSSVPNDYNFINQWHLEQESDFDLNAPETWDLATGDENVIVAILDSGVRYFHKDLGGSTASYNYPENAEGNMWISLIEKNGTEGIDDDDNGYVDDWIGWDFVDNAAPCWSDEDCDSPDNDPRDYNGHGTHCAGNVAAITNNGYATQPVWPVAGEMGD